MRCLLDEYSVLTLRITTKIFVALSSFEPDVEIELMLNKLFSIGKYSKMHLIQKYKEDLYLKC